VHVPDLFSFPAEPALPDVPALPDGLLPEWGDLSALVWVGGALVGVLLLYVLLLLPLAVFGHGRAGHNARALIGQIFGLFRTGISAAGHHRDCNDADPGDAAEDGPEVHDESRGAGGGR
jgi:hypothetical protein